MNASPHFPDAATISCGGLSGRPFFNNQLFITESIVRIYYAKKGLRGKPYRSDIINADLFTFFRGKYRTPDEETLRAANAFTECGRDMDDNTDCEYVCKEGTFYIPKSIYVGEMIKPGEVFDLYFVVLCGDEVELRHLYWDRPWHEMVGRDTEITDPAVIAKIERTIALYKEANMPKKPEPVLISRKALLRFLTLLGVADAESLAGKIHTAATKPAESAALLKEFGIEDAYSGWHLTVLRRALRDRKRLDWVDWNEAPEEVIASLCALLPPGAGDHLASRGHDEDADPAEVLRDSKPLLHALYGLTILLWDTGGDEYVFFVVPSAKVAEAFEVASDLGIPLQQVEDVFSQE